MSRCARFRETPTGRRLPESGALSRAAVAALAAFLLLVSATPRVAAETPDLSEAGRREQAGDREGAIGIYRAWLRESPDPARVDAVFAVLFRLETDLTDLLDLASAPGIGPEPLLALSRLAEMSGRLEEARTLAERARQAGAGVEAMITTALLALEMNDAEAIAGALDSLRAKGDAWEVVVDGYRDIAAERWDLAREKLARAAESSADPRIALAGLWGLYECSRRSGDAEGTAAAAAAIGRRFPGAPEEALTAGRASLWPNPSQFATGLPGDAAPLVKAGAFSVQAGSFLVRENAEELAADLAEKGFHPVVLEETSQGKSLFKLYAGIGMEREAALSLADSLRRAGYAGFLISEGR
jgi:hypothetical protein